MGKFKEIDQFCKNDDGEGLVDFLAEHGVQNPHKQANIYLEEYRMNKANEMEERIKKQSVIDKILEIMSERISTLNERADVLSSRIDIVNERVDNIIEYFEKISGGK